MAEDKASKLESRLSALEMGGPPQMAYFMPQMAYNAHVSIVPTTNISVPPLNWWQNQYQQGGGKQDYSEGNVRI